MVKKILIIFLMSIIFCGTVHAEAFYENNNGVVLSEPEYNFIKELYNENYPSIITLEEYNALKEHHIFGNEIKHMEINDYGNQDNNGMTLYTQFHETNYKRLELNYACSDDCLIASTLDWKVIPAVKSYDIYGLYQNGSSKPYFVTSAMYYKGLGHDPVEYVLADNGAAAIHKLPSSFNSLTFDFSCYVKKSGTVVVSYQHARKATTLAKSKKFQFHYNGYGNVFLFEEAVRPYYDQMMGLEIKF